MPRGIQRGGQRGSSLTEFGLIVPILLLLTFGIIDLGRGVWAYNTLSHAAREGARYAMIRGATSDDPATSGEISEVVRSKAIGLYSEKVKVSTWWNPDNNPGSVVEVRVEYNFRPVTPLIPNNEMTFESTSRMVISR